MNRTRYEASLDKRNAVERAESDGVVSDSFDVRGELMKRVHSGAITLKEAQSELKKIKQEGKSKGLKTRNQVFTNG